MKAKDTIRVLILVLGLLLIAPATYAQEANVADDGAPAAAEAESEEMFVGLSIDEELGIEEEDGDGSDLINISVEDETLDIVVQMFTRMSGINIIATSSNLTGTVTVNLVDVEWKPALTSILAMHRLTLLERTPGSGVYMITPQVEGAPEPLVVATIFLQYTTVSEIAPVVNSMLAANGAVSEFAERNALIIKSTESNLGEIKNLIKEIDISSKQVSIEAKFMELNDSATKQLGLKWSSLAAFNMQLKAGPFSSLEQSEHFSDWDDSSRSRSTAYVDDRNFIFEDIYGSPVSLTDSTVIFDSDRGTTASSQDEGGAIFKANTLGDDAVKIGTGLLKSSSGGSAFSTTGTGTGVMPDRIAIDARSSESDVINDVRDRFVESIIQSSSTVLDIDALNLVLSALKTTDGVSIVSNPKMIVANGTTNAFFRVGNRWPIVRTSITSGTADSPGDAIDARLDLDIDTDYISGGYLRTGIELKVIPVVKADNLIQATITPTLTSKLSQDKVVAGNSWPQLQVKEINTRFTLLSGQTVAIGGLTSTRDSKIVTKVPVLGDIPLIGKYLFTHTEEAEDQVETIIFVTLALASPESLYPEIGMPEDTRLAQIRMLQDRKKKEKFMSDLERMKESQDVEREMQAERIKSRLLKRKK